MRDETIDSFLSRLAARTPVPGGGATAALHAAQAAALLGMTARYSDTVREPPWRPDTIDMMATEADRLREVSADLMAVDGEAFGAVAAAYRLPKDTDEQRSARSAAIAAAMIMASSPPAELIGIGSQLLDLAESLQPIVNPTVAGDVAAAVQAVRAAVTTSRVNVEANLSGVTDPGARERLTSAIASADDLQQQADRITEAVRAAIAS